VRAFTTQHDGAGAQVSPEAVLAAVRCVAWRLAIPSFRTLYVSANAADVLGHPAERWRDTTAWLETVHPDDRQRVQHEADAGLAAGRPFERDYRIVRADGRMVWVHDNIGFARDADGTIVELQGVTLDVTARRQHEERLRDDARRLELALREVRLRSLLLDSLGEGVTLARYDGTILYTNAALDRMFGYAPRELVGRSLRELSSRTGPDYERRRAVLRVAVERDGFWSGPMLSCRRDGTPLQTHGTITRVAVDGELLWVTVRRDVTERHRLQREVLDASQREKESLAHELHEGLGQQLTGVALLAGTLRDEARRLGPELAAGLGRLAGLLLDAVGTCRRLAQGVSGFVVRNGGLGTGLRELALSHEQRSGAHCAVQCDERVSGALLPERARHLYWIAEEALALPVDGDGPRHAGLRLDETDGRARLRVTLPGVVAERLDADDGALLRIIGYRAALLGAALATLPDGTGGVMLECVCPMDDGIGAST
jgi:PAS domain S-box-containing protein